MAEETVTAAAPVETPNWDDELTAAGIPATDTTATPTILSTATAAGTVGTTTELVVDAPTATTLVPAAQAMVAAAVSARVNNPMDYFRETLRQMGAVIGEGRTSFLLAEFFGVSNIDELEGADVFSALEKFDKLQP